MFLLTVRIKKCKMKVQKEGYFEALYQTEGFFVE